MPKSLWRFWSKYLFAKKGWLAGFFGALVFARLVQYSLYPIFSKYIIDWIGNPPVENLLGYAMPLLVGFAAVMAAVHVAWFLRYFFERKIEEYARMHISEDLQTYVNSQSISFYSKTEPGKIARNMDYINEGFYACMPEGWVSFSVSFGVVILSTILLIQASPLLAAMFFGFNLIGVIWTIYSMPVLAKWSDKWADLHSDISGALNDSLSNFITVKLFAGARREREILRPARERLRRIGIKHELADCYFWIPSSYILDFAVIACMGVCIWLAMRGHMTAGDAVFCIMTYKTVTDMVFEMLLKVPAMVKGYSSAKSAYRELVRPVTICDAPGAPELNVARGEIVVRNLSFRFPDAKEYVLQNLNLKIAPGEKIGIVGLSGNGKTTLARLIMRFYDPTRGEILIDGQNIRDVTQDSLRRNIAFVPQDETMFNRTLRENIGYGREDAGFGEIQDAARRSNSFDFIMKTVRGFKTVVGTRGIKLSGGQRQRVSIARAFLKDAPILVLDEATSALDSQSEAVVQESIEHLTRNRTCLIIAHRLSTLKHVDRIIVLENGRVAESGRHADLIRRRGGIYARLWRMQSCGFIGE